MKISIKTSLIALTVTALFACSTGPQPVESEGDSGDSASLGAGPDTTGTTVDTGSSVTDSL